VKPKEVPKPVETKIPEKKQSSHAEHDNDDKTPFPNLPSEDDPRLE
jgi:hypothetical protein